MQDSDCVKFLQWALPKLRMRWPGFRKVRRQVCKRVARRLRQLGLEHVSEYREYVEGHENEWLMLDEMCRISISRFYRDRAVFDLLRDEVLHELAASARALGDTSIHAWSGGCASGEEAYTLKLVWELRVQRDFPEVSLKVTATDADPYLLQRARNGCYPLSSVKDFPKEWMPIAFDTSGDEVRVRDRFRNGITFLRQDIRREQPPGPFDLIFCRYLVFTYFDEPLQSVILRHIIARLRPGRILVIGKKEALPSAIDHGLRLRFPHSGIVG
jgi:chemotaxis protein methyltransferase CheR